MDAHLYRPEWWGEHLELLMGQRIWIALRTREGPVTVLYISLNLFCYLSLFNKLNFDGTKNISQICELGHNGAESSMLHNN